jgi:hypothetical protein
MSRFGLAMRKFFIIITIFIVSKYSVTAQNSYSLDFDGEGDYVEIIDESAMIANADQMTLSGWVYPRGPNADSWTQFDGFFGFRNNNDADFYLLQLGAYKVEGRLRVSGGGEFTIETAENSIISETWHHLALTYNGSNIILYIDGIEAGSTEASGQITNESVPLKIGSLVFDNTNFDLDGQVDEVSLWNIALTQQQVQDYMEADLTDATGLVGYWNFNSGSGETANDASGNENHGSIYGATWSTNVPFQQTYSGPVWHVATTGSDSTGDGSADNPFATIQTGIDSASDGDTVLVATGTYVENINFNGKNIVVMSTDGANNTIIDGNDNNNSVVTFINGETNSAHLKGFTLINGTGNWIGDFNAEEDGGGIFCYSSNPTLSYLLIYDNYAALYGGGVFLWDSSPIFSNVVISNNEAAGGISNDPNVGSGIYSGGNSNPVITNTIIWGNLPESDAIDGIATVSYSNIQGGWEGEGNIDGAPLFCNPDSGDYTLAENSPCIDAGDPSSPLDSDGTIADMGAFGVGCSAILAIEEEFIPMEFALHQNYPNPFNPLTTLRYDLSEQSLVNIIIYDMLGREVKTLVNTTQDAGFKSVSWNATNDYGKPVSAGVYLYQIQAGEFVQTNKMVLLK